LNALFGFSQSDTTDESAFGRQIFLPSLEAGYMFQVPDNLSGGIILKTSIEYRFRNNNDVFIRANYDNYNSEYEFSSVISPTNVLKGTASFSDLIIGAGYRFGETKHRLFFLAQGGVKFYNYSTASIDGGSIVIDQSQNEIFTTRFSIGYEYYFTEKSAVNIDLMHGQVWSEEDFWIDDGTSFGVSVGFITSLF
jgi:hypothetical protein